MLVKQADGINDHIGGLRLVQHLEKILVAGIVPAIADQNENSFLMCVGLEMAQSDCNGVVQGRAPTTGAARYGALQHINVIGKRDIRRKAQRDRIGKVNDELPVLWIANLDEGSGAFDHLRLPSGHATAVVYEQSSRDRDVLGAKKRDLLLAAVLVNPEVRRIQTRHKSPAFIAYDYGHNDEINVFGNNVWWGPLLSRRHMRKRKEGQKRAHAERPGPPGRAK